MFPVLFGLPAVDHFHNQVSNKIDSPAHAGEFFVDILQTIHVSDLMARMQKVDPDSAGYALLGIQEIFLQHQTALFPGNGRWTDV